MAASNVAEPSVQPQDEVDLTDEQIQQLLLEAEGRLRGPDTQSTELDIGSLRIPKLSSGSSLEPYVKQNDDVSTAKTAELVDKRYKELSNKLHTTSGQKPAVQEKPTAGPEWFDLPKTVMTTEFKRDLQLLRMRSVLDSKRHYKKENGKAKAPEFSQVGTIIQGPTEFFSGRIAKKDRKKTFVEETMATERQNRKFESKYRDIQDTKTSGKKAYYNNLKAQRKRTKK
ncbi:hypothetical protein N7509_005391 [Penicillium cosmopolitanum]|uniref:Fcf2 pre-rRNA processing C-terminal domain-containing protein n=1 Tax=Penicillium cosmopolitanum TaxID=1131564 RepID=A0A9X0BA16_9EURO|nr:uncharacterized protein N7509_005391 [Penicillium cosmopolitanum]KAJ5397278.1 hypothetical protein N7509_005391 [Penicillium cosmopolitanum]